MPYLKKFMTQHPAHKHTCESQTQQTLGENDAGNETMDVGRERSRMQTSLDKCESCEENGNGGKDTKMQWAQRVMRPEKKEYGQNRLKVGNTRKGFDCAIREHK